MSKLVVHWIVTARYFLLIAGLVAVVAASWGAKWLWFESDYDIYFPADDPQLIAFESIERDYTKEDNVAFVLAPDDGALFTNRSLDAISWLTNKGWELPRSIRVDSLTNYQHSESVGGDLFIYPLWKEDVEHSKDDIDVLRNTALSQPEIAGNLVSLDGDVTLVNVKFELPEDSRLREEAVIEVMASVRNLESEFKSTHPGITVHIVGVLPLSNAFNELSLKDSATLIPSMFLLVLIILWYFLRSPLAVFSVVLTIIASVSVMLGSMGWLGYRLNQVNTSSVVIILTLAISDCVHIYVSFLGSRHFANNRIRALKESLEANFTPIVLTSVTTAIGFFSLNLGASPVFREFGTSVGIGVLGTMLCTFFIVPVAAPFLASRTVNSVRGSVFVEAIGSKVLSRHESLCGAAILFAIVLSFCGSLNEFNDDSVGYLDKSTQTRQAFDFVDDRLTGTDSILYSLSAGGADGIYEPAYLEKVEAFANWYREQSGVAHVTTITDVIKRIHKTMHNEDPVFYRIPDSREVIAQYLLMYELSLPIGLSLDSLVTFDRSASLVRVLITNVKAKRLLEYEAGAQDWLALNAPSIAAPGSSVSIMFARIGQDNTIGMLRGALIATLLIATLLVLAFRSVKFGLLSLVPNIFPAAIVFGFWGIAKGEINLAAAAIYSITLGIVVDNTIHFLNKYLVARRSLSLDVRESILYSFRVVGVALTITAIALTAGFFVLGLSDFSVNSTLGLMAGMTILVALVFDLVSLPGLIVWFEAKRVKQVESVNTNVEVVDNPPEN